MRSTSSRPLARTSPAALRAGLISALLLTLVRVSGAQAVRDSAGVRIVENSRPLLPASRTWRVDDRPTLHIGGLDGDSLYEFLRVMGVVKLSDGRIAVANQGTSTIRFYNPAGKYLSAASRSGQGPGELRQILGMVRIRGDTLVVMDLAEVEYFTAAGRWVRRGAGGDRHAYIYPGAVFENGDYVGLDWNARREVAAGRPVDSVPLVRVTADGARSDVLGRFPSAAQGVFSPGAYLAAAGSGFHFGFAKQYEIGFYSVAGGLERLVRRTAERRPVSDADRREYREWFVNVPGEDGRPSPRFRAFRESRVGSLVFAEHYPAFSALRTDRYGHLWVRMYDSDVAMGTPGPVSVRTFREPEEWDVFDQSGRWLCTVRLPARFTPLDIGGDYIAGLWRDLDDVEHVRLYALVKP